MRRVSLLDPKCFECCSCDELLQALGQTPWWQDLVAGVTALDARSGTSARQQAAGYASVYAGHRASMIVDVVMSQRRKYPAVLTFVKRFQATPSAASISALAAAGVPPAVGIPSARVITIEAVARGLDAFGVARGLHSDDDLVMHWADATGCFATSPGLDPFLGRVPGIGVALYAYLRMRSGARTIKPDVRVVRSLVAAGAPVGLDVSGALLIARALCCKLDIDPLVLDQLLWN